MGQINDSTKIRERGHLNFEERKIIERLFREGTSKAEIARLLKRDKNTIKREIRRGSMPQKKRSRYESKKPDYPEFIAYTAYFAEAGQRQYEKNRSGCGAKNKATQCAGMVSFVEGKLKSEGKWSVDAAVGYAIANGLFERTFSTKTFYNWIDDGLVGIKNLDLPLKVRRKPKSPRRERKRIYGKGIDERPEIVSAREEFGHWEGDGIVGKEQKGFLITLVERKLGLGLLFNAGDKTKEKIVGVLDRLENQYQENFGKMFKSITFDNGSEFASADEMERHGRTAVYYAHPYSSFERGTNENWNGMVRRFIPKGSSFDTLTGEDMNRIAHYINTLPRKRFGYKTPLQMWEAEIESIMAKEAPDLNATQRSATVFLN
jgi:IS30 family transposase